MKHLRFVFVLPILVLLSSVPFHVFATDSTTSANSVTTTLHPTIQPIEIHATNKAEVQTMVREKNDEIKATIVTKRAEVKAKIDAMKDQAKKTIATRIQERLTMINANRTDHFTKLLSRLSEILTKIATRTAKVKETGKNVTPIDEAITSAQTSIANAELTVKTQSDKTYTLEVTDDMKAKEEINTIKEQLRVDLESTKDVVKAAHTSVQNVFEAIRSVVGSSEATPSIKVTPNTTVVPTGSSTGNGGI
jgi:hypothetical protein